MLNPNAIIGISRCVTYEFTCGKEELTLILVAAPGKGDVVYFSTLSEACYEDDGDAESGPHLYRSDRELAFAFDELFAQSLGRDNLERLLHGEFTDEELCKLVQNNREYVSNLPSPDECDFG